MTEGMKLWCERMRLVFGERWVTSRTEKVLRRLWRSRSDYDTFVRQIKKKYPEEFSGDDTRPTREDLHTLYWMERELGWPTRLKLPFDTRPKEWVPARVALGELLVHAAVERWNPGWLGQFEVQIRRKS